MRRLVLPLLAAAVLSGCWSEGRFAEPSTTIADESANVPTTLVPTTLTGPGEALAIMEIVDADTVPTLVTAQADLAAAIASAMLDPADNRRVAEFAPKLRELHAARLFRWQSVEPRIQALGGEWIEAFHEIRAVDERGIDMTKTLEACATGCDAEYVHDLFMRSGSPDWRVGMSKLRILLQRGS